MRLFVAFSVPGDVQACLRELQGRIPSSEPVARVVPAKAFHLTLKFIGDWPDGRVDEIRRALSAVRFAPFELTLKGTGVFPSEQHVNVVWVGLEPEAPIAALQQAIEAALAPLLPREDRFTPHLTLCRVKSVADKQAFLDGIRKLEPRPLRFRVSHIELIRSTLTPDGPVYETLAAYPAA
jgi:2'-5' RNA ligase